ncbi:ethionine resistance protein [Sporothrix bragantina]|uniref:Ethionine resistance protein n=1 Tax=Sporothrix bragantina TaxID=671064 RepID=A0ABP0CZR3_9PEZI
MANERTALLASSAGRPAVQSHPSEKAGITAWTAEMLLLAKASIPVMLAYMLQNSLQTVSVLVVGRLSPDALATAAFSYMFAMATGWLVALGGTTAIDTLASSCFTGAANSDKGSLGVLLQRGMVVLSATYGMVALFWWFGSGPLFHALGQDPIIASQSARFLRLLAPGGLGYVWFECLKKYLQAQGINSAGTYVLLITAPLNAVLQYLLVYRAGLGLDGAPLATGIAYWLSFALLALYAASAPHRGRAGWSGWALSRAVGGGGLASFTRLAVLGIVHVGSEWWAFEIVALAAGCLGMRPLAAQSVIMTMDQVINTVPFGLGVAASARVGHRLGARDASGARRAAHAAALLSILFGTFLLTVLMSSRHVLGRLFSDDADVAALVAAVMPYVALFQIADGLNGSCGGALRGMGRQWVGALVNLVSYYGAALPAGIFLAFQGGWGLSGLWLGQCVALFLVGLLEWGIVANSNWPAEVRRAFDRLEAGGITTIRSDVGV